MREYRGKRKANGEWVHGWYHELDHPDHRGKAYIIPKYASALYSYEVDPETVGQYTGLKDKNGIEIYKGDVWLYHGVGYHVCWHEDEAKFYFKHPSLHAGDDDHIDLGWSSHGEIIGDIIDNPELLEG